MPGTVKKFLQYHFNARNENGIAHKFRMKRMLFFEKCFEETFREQLKTNTPITVLDVGGTWNFWETMNFKYFTQCTITLLNLNEYKIPEKFKNIKSVIGDATDLSKYSEKQFDLVFSNSVIEHVGKEQAQKKMADELLRVGKHLYVQTPNKNFPIEPHFIFPLFQFLPLKLKIFLLTHFALGWYANKVSSKDEAKKIAESVDLLDLKRLRKFFPNAKIQKEKIFPFTKSFYFFI